MIGRLRGRIVEREPGRVLLDVSGVGYVVQIPLSTFYVLCEQSGPDATLHVHTHVREESLDLFGFATRDERSSFELLIGISGVGPKLALAILSGIGADELRVAVALKDRPRLQSIPGVGRKTAERLLLELRDKYAAEPDSPAGGKPPTGEEETGVDEQRTDAISALVNLGYTRDRATHAVDTARKELDESAALESLLRSALGRLAR